MAAAHELLYYIFRSGFLRNRLFRATVFRYVFSITQKRFINNETVKKCSKFLFQNMIFFKYTLSYNNIFLLSGYSHNLLMRKGCQIY